MNNPLNIMNAGERFAVTEDIELEFIRVQHSIVDCVFAAIHTPKGIIVYANDFKIDRSPPWASHQTSLGCEPWESREY